QKSHVDHSKSPQPKPSGKCVHMGQFSVTIYGATGSVLSDNQHSSPSAPLSALAKPVGTGEGIYTPGGEVPAEPVEANDDADVPNVETNDSGKSPATEVQTFTGTPEGKGSLK
ncbi:hypothetical protein J3456_15815, partial [Sulfitobacter sp. NFXS29]